MKILGAPWTTFTRFSCRCMSLMYENQLFWKLPDTNNKQGALFFLLCWRTRREACATLLKFNHKWCRNTCHIRREAALRIRWIRLRCRAEWKMNENNTRWRTESKKKREECFIAVRLIAVNYPIPVLKLEGLSPLSRLIVSISFSCLAVSTNNRTKRESWSKSRNYEALGSRNDRL